MSAFQLCLEKIQMLSQMGEVVGGFQRSNTAYAKYKNNAVMWDNNQQTWRSKQTIKRLKLHQRCQKPLNLYCNLFLIPSLYPSKWTYQMVLDSPWMPRATWHGTTHTTRYVHFCSVEAFRVCRSIVVIQNEVREKRMGEEKWHQHHHRVASAAIMWNWDCS